ncbi:hypothetical protein [Variovorax paradoxus]|uniref:hypothetical protein n=1 Tax=Variovorax paradoxus TaxID=34073 RepID=UPI0024818E51|nr:hypothetical protein [Variovorax paradoxus]WGT62413.1 hypothetical protein QHG62_20455 [Variovorax paradoxus]
MNREDLEHTSRAAYDATGEYVFIIRRWVKLLRARATTFQATTDDAHCANTAIGPNRWIE